MDIASILGNPIYAFGIYLEPAEETFFWIQAFNRSLPDQFWQLDLKKQEKIYRTFIEWIAQNHFVEIIQRDVQPLITIKEWIAAQKRLVSEIISLPDKWSFISDKVKEYIDINQLI